MGRALSRFSVLFFFSPGFSISSALPPLSLPLNHVSSFLFPVRAWSLFLGVVRSSSGSFLPSWLGFPAARRLRVASAHVSFFPPLGGSSASPPSAYFSFAHRCPPRSRTITICCYYRFSAGALPRPLIAPPLGDTRALSALLVTFLAS